MNPYRDFVAGSARLFQEGQSLPLGQAAPLDAPSIDPNAPKALIFSPHPDDEVIIGGLPLRLMRQHHCRIVNVAVTQGSNPQRQPARWTELEACCRHIGFELQSTRPNGLIHINPRGRREHPDNWAASVDCIANILKSQSPQIVFFPHERDWNQTHIGTHHLLMDALRSLGPHHTCFAVETEFWGAMDEPNLMVESSVDDVADLIAALTFHVGEVQRNPYHLRLPGWLMDNVRRGGELVGGQGGAAPNFTFATLYRLRRWNGSELVNVFAGGKFLDATASPLELFL